MITTRVEIDGSRLGGGEEENASHETSFFTSTSILQSPLRLVDPWCHCLISPSGLAAHENTANRNRIALGDGKGWYRAVNWESKHRVEASSCDIAIG